MSLLVHFFFFFFFNDTETSEIYTLSLHDALPISPTFKMQARWFFQQLRPLLPSYFLSVVLVVLSSLMFLLDPLLMKRSEEHTSELQSRRDLVCRLLLEKKKDNTPQSR